MFNYIRSELTRVLSKKGSYIYYLVFIALFMVFLFIDNGSEQSHGGMAMIGTLLISMSMVFFGARIYGDVYGDDLSHKTLSLVFSTGLSKLKFVVSKLIVFILVTLLVYLVFGLVFMGIWGFLVGFLPALNSPEMMILLKTTIVALLSLFGFASISSIVSYTFKSATAGVILLMMIGMGLTNQIFKLLTLLNDVFVGVYDNLLSTLMNNLNGLIPDGAAISSHFYLMVIAYIIVGLVLSTLALEKRDV